MYSQISDLGITDAPETILLFFLLHLAEQYLTSCQTFSHFLRHVNGRRQAMHTLLGRLDFSTPLGNQSFPSHMLPKNSTSLGFDK